ncbi:MAG: hypothetical protein QOI47_1694, partial [Actinomycetota bacterium]|nr:hypothetical protein [Actinomycetota bacterium]
RAGAALAFGFGVELDEDEDEDEDADVLGASEVSVGGVVDVCTAGSPLCVPTSSLRFFSTATTAIAITTATTTPPRIKLARVLMPSP